MQWTTPPEMTTAVTDFLLGCLALLILFRLRPLADRAPMKIKLWSWILGLLALASFYGTIAHAVVMSPETLNAFWMPLTFILGMMVSLFVAAILYEWRGEPVLRKSLAVMLTLGVVFFIGMFVLSRMITGYFIVFIAYSTLTMLFSLGLCLVLAVRRSDGTLGLMAAGIALIIAGSGIQAMRSIEFTVIWAFDYNSVYHFFTMAAALFFYGSIRKSLTARA